MKKKYLISICMMVKDEEKNLPRCLDALKPLLVRPDVELIIVDTGSSDRSAVIARGYTAKVYFHQWDGHFSGMRNITISYARGEFIFILDADEVLLDAAGLYASILKNNKCDTNTLSLKIKNLNSGGGHTFISQARIFRNDGQFRYEGAVHNQPKFTPPVINIDVTLEHYGYLFYDSELREKKFNRTAGILRDELKKDPNNIYYRYQLAKSNNANRDKKGALAEIRKAHKLLAGDEGKRKLHIYIYGSYANLCCDNNEFDEAISVCMEGLEVEPEYVDLYYLMAAAYEALGNKKAALECFTGYIDIVKSFDGLAISKSTSIEMIYNGSAEINNACLFIANEAYLNQEFDKAYEYINKIDDNETRMLLYVRILLKLKKYNELRETYIKHRDEKAVHDIIVETIEVTIEKYSVEQKNEISKLFCEDGDIYSLLNMSRIGIVSGEELLGDKNIKEADFNNLPLFFSELFIDIDKNTRQIISIFRKLQKSIIRKYVNKLISKKNTLKEFFEELLGKGSFRDDYYSAKLYVGIAYTLLFNRAAILKNLNSEPPEQYCLIFKNYIEYGKKYVECLYDTERLRLFYTTLEDREDKFFIGLYFAEKAVEKGEYKAGVNYFKEAARANPHMAAYMGMYQDELFPDTDSSEGKGT